MKTSMKLGSLVAAALIAASGASIAAPVNPYVTDSNKANVMNPFGLCWRTGYWTPALAEQSAADGVNCACDKDIIKSGACGKKTPAAQPKVAKVTLAADTLFDFDKTSLKADGQTMLDELVSRMAGMNVEVVLATGYADRLGTEQYNEKISLARAEAVKSYLEMKGVASDRVQTEGRGAAEPVVNCPDPSKNGQVKTKAQLIDCLAPNRRAVIEVIGTRAAK